MAETRERLAAVSAALPVVSPLVLRLPLRRALRMQPGTALRYE